MPDWDPSPIFIVLLALSLAIVLQLIRRGIQKATRKMMEWKTSPARKGLTDLKPLDDLEDKAYLGLSARRTACETPISDYPSLQDAEGASRAGTAPPPGALPRLSARPRVGHRGW